MSDSVYFKQQDLQGSITIEDNEGLHLKFSGTGATAILTDVRTTGKIYYEVTILNRGTNAHYIGAFYEGSYVGTSIYANGFGLYIHADISTFRKSTRATVENTTTIPVGTVFGVAIDYDNKSIYYYKNGQPYANIAYTYSDIKVVYGGGSSASGEALFNFGASSFKYDIPEGYHSYDGSQHNDYNHKVLFSSEKNKKISVNIGKSEKTEDITGEALEIKSTSSGSVYAGTKPESVFYEESGDFYITVPTMSLEWKFENPVTVGVIGIEPYSSGFVIQSFSFYGKNSESEPWNTIESKDGLSFNEKALFELGETEEYIMYRLVFSRTGSQSWNRLKRLFIEKRFPILTEIEGVEGESLFNDYGIAVPDLPAIDMSSSFTEKHYINNQSTSLGEGKVFKHTLDSNKILKKISVK